MSKNVLKIIAVVFLLIATVPVASILLIKYIYWLVEYFGHIN